MARFSGDRFDRRLLLTTTALVGISLSSAAQADTFVVITNADSGAGSLRQAIISANAVGGSNSISFNVAPNSTINLGSSLPAIASSVTIDGAGSAGLTVSGQNASRVFFVQSGTVSISNLTIANGSATGGAGAAGGGGGLGAGGAIFVNAGTTTLSNVSFANNKANGGAGGGAERGSTGSSGGGGGGLGGGGGNPVDGGGGGGGYSGGGGGAGGYAGAAGGAGGAGAGGAGGTGGAGNGSAGAAGTNGGNGGAGASSAGGGGGGGGLGGGNGGAAGGSAGAGGGGGGGLVAGSGGAGGSNNGQTTGAAGGVGGGGGGARFNGGPGGAGGDFGGGGGGSSGSTGGIGGFGGGGGGSGTGGTGGFGGGGGGSTSAATVAGGIGGGTGAAGGGGGAAFGGAVFVRSGAGLVVTTSGVSSSFQGSTVTAGAGGATAGKGAAVGSDLFLQTGTSTTLAPGGGTSLTIAGSIGDDSATSVPVSQTYKPGSGIGGALKIGTGASTGTVILSGANTYAGGTTFASGTLQAASTGALSSTGNLSFSGGTLQYSDANQTDYSSRFATTANQLYSIDTNGQTVTFATALTSQGGSLTKLGNGTLALTAANTYSGGTTIAGGTLSVANDGNLGAASGGLTLSGGTLEIRPANGFTSARAVTLNAASTVQVDTSENTATLSGVISGPSSLTKTGSGVLVLAGTNTYAGGTTISAGLLQLGSGGTTGSITGPVTNNANLFFNRSNTYQFDGVISGTGAVRQIGTGTTILTAANTYAGGTTISGGTLQLGNGGLTGSIVGNVTNNANLAFNRSDSYSFGGVIAGTGNVQQIGTGTTILTAANTYTGATTINAGTLQVDGSIASPNVTVNNGGTLSGIGKIGDPQINAGGTLSPGNAANPTGTLTIVGPLGFAAGSFYNVSITPAANSRTNVTGVTTIAGGTVQVKAGSGTYATNQRYTILTSTGGVAGTFTQATVNTNFAFLTPTLSYDANDVYLTVLPSAPTPQGTPDYRTAAITRNQLAVAAGLTNAGAARPTGSGGRIVTGLNQLTAPEARAAFDALSGEGLTAAQNIANRSTELFTSSIFDQTTFYSSAPSANSITLFDAAPIRELADLPSRRVEPAMPVTPNRTWRAWATGFGGQDNIHGNGQIGSSYQENTIYGGTLGVDYQLTPNYLVGVAIGGTNGDFLVPGRATSGSTTGGHVAFYDLATFGSFYGASSTSFSYFDNRATRTVSGFGGLNTETERANFNSNEFRSRLEFGRHLAGYGGLLTPFVALELAELRSNGFTENAVQGAGLFRLNVSGQSQASAPAFVGVRLQRATSIGNGITLSPTLQVAYVHEFAPYRSQIGTLADLPGSTFLVDGARPSRNAAQVKAGAEMAIGARSVIFANFDGEFSSVNQLYAGKGGFRYSW